MPVESHARGCGTNFDRSTEAHYDASHAAPPVKSVQAHAVQLYGGLVAASLTCIPSAMKASFNAELYAAVLAAYKVEWVRAFSLEYGVKIEGPTLMFGDNSAVGFMAKPGAAPKLARHDAIRVAILQEKSAPNGPVAPSKIPTEMNRVDFWTKHVGGDKQFESMSLLLNISNRVAPSVPLAYKIGVALKLLGKN